MTEHPTPAIPRVSWLHWCALLLILIPALLRALVTGTVMPWWDSDPSVAAPTGTAMTPTGGLLLDIGMVLGAALAAWDSGRRNRVAVSTVLVAAGAIAVLWHASRETEHLVIGGAWIAGIAGMLGVGWLSERRETRGLVLGLSLGVVALLCARSLVQVLVDHPQTVSHFNANRDRVLAAQGWAPGSPQALMYERRLIQPDATAWFGLSNVLATFAAAAAVFGILAAWCIRERASRFSLAVLGVLGLGLLWMTGSKGGWGAGSIGGIVAVAFALGGRFSVGKRWRIWLPLAAACGVLVIIVVRGFVGERLGELSLLFRAQYMEAAWRIFAQNPLIGVGPSGFQDAYLLAKNPLNPEEITSPHSVLFDWLATLGLLGLPWVWLLLRRSRFGPPQHDDGDVLEAESEIASGTGAVARRVLILVPIGLFAISAWFEQAMLLPIEIMARMIGVAAWIGFAIMISRAVRGSLWVLTPALIGTSATLVVHAMIELTPVHTGSAPLLLVLIGSLWTGRGVVSTASVEDSRGGLVGALILAGVAIAMGWVGLRPLTQWERHLHAAAIPLVDAGRALRLDPNQPPNRVLGPARRLAIDELGRAIDARPNHVKTRIEASRLALQNALATPGESTRWLEAARDWASGPEGKAPNAQSLRWLAVIDRVSIEAGLSPDPVATREHQIETLIEAAKLDPNNPGLAAQIAVALDVADRPSQAADWANRALELDGLARLDPLKRIPAEQREPLNRLANPG